jgi:hypothetical protein
MDESSPVPLDQAPIDRPEDSENPLVLASIVAEQVEIDAVILAESRTKRTSTFGSAGEKIGFKYEIQSVGFGKDVELKKFYAVPSFSMKSMIGNEEDKEQNLFIEATFVLSYGLQSFDGIEDKHLQAYATTNGVFNAWPYWREFVQNTTARMGIGPIAVPVFRF